MSRKAGDVLNWLRFQAWRPRHEITWRMRKLRELTGEFDQPETSSRAESLTRTWENQWPGDEPLSYLVGGGAERSFRFHNLPASKRYADSEHEYKEILRRQQEVLSELTAGADLSSLVIVAAEWGARTLGSGQSRRNLTDGWPWRIGQDRFDPEALPVYFWVQLGTDVAGLQALLRAGADAEGRYLFTDRTMTWLFCPYDGGVDVVLPSSNDRDELARKYAAWLPD